MKAKKNIWLWLALIVVLLFITKYATNSWRKYQLWQDHKAYFEKPVEQRSIKAWMTPNFIKRHYDLDLSSILGFSPSFWEQKKPLNLLCPSYQIDCTVLVAKLNRHIDSVNQENQKELSD